MMTPHEVIESYVRDVAYHLPRDKRADVAFELRGLLHDELAAKARALGGKPDRDIVMQVLAGFGRPAEAAARYQPRAPLIDPADNHSLIIWSVVGALVLSLDESQDTIGTLQWVGIVFLWFTFSAWRHRRWPSEKLRWSPQREAYPEVASRPPLLIAGVATLLFPFAMMLSPHEWWHTVTFGMLPASGLVLTDAYLGSWQRSVLLVALALMAGVYFVAAWRGGWIKESRQALIGTGLCVGGMLVAHAAPMVTLLGREPFTVFESPLSNTIALPILGLVGGLMVVASMYEIYREWARVTPAPAQVST